MSLHPGMTVPEVFRPFPEIRAFSTYRHPGRPGNFDFRRREGVPWEENLAAVAEEGLGLRLGEVALPSKWGHGEVPMVFPAAAGYTPVGSPVLNPNPTGDAMYTALPRRGLIAMGADCPGALIYDPTHRVIAVAHGGWKPLAAGVVIETLVEMIMEYDTKIEDLWVYLAPGVGIESFQLDEPARETLDSSTVADSYQAFCTEPDAKGKFYFGLNECFRGEFLEAGVPTNQIEYNADDTFLTLDPETGDYKYHSARREGEEYRGNMAWGIAMIY